ncbi:N-acyl-D-amino-acid deacylase [Sphingomonas laterariae]|uniref:N-acyl-D-amino-acid deacylase n=1 Tax=Edaphosphingomonas laterariae TaxID=861865 RepID=A0A239HYU3_9SPHN|nr:amidohydrolase family protein [Sphingomonas laterariae]SNS86495.1 N-acyl-D-amino-acid deacylase [Sphingomonas laterariae]
MGGTRYVAAFIAASLATAGWSAAAHAQAYDVVIRNGTLYDGSGAPGRVGDLAIKGDRLVAVGKVDGKGWTELDARGLAVAPGFINMLSWATESLIADGRSQSDIRQGVTLEVMGEGSSMGPLNPAMKADALQRQGDIRYPISWTTLGEYLQMLETKGVSTNVASFVGAETVRVHELGEGDVDPTPAQLDRMKALVSRAMNEGAMGVGSSLIYAPGTYAETPELIAITRAAAQCGGMYISHMRSEGDRLIEAIDELIEIARQSGAPAEIYHLKMAGRANWGKYDAAIARIEAARAEGLRITADMYTYPAGATGLDAAMPTWVQAGGLEQWIGRLKDPAARAKVAAEMAAPGDGWENFYLGAGAKGMLLVGFKNPALKPLTGKTLAEVAAMRGKSPEETAMDLVVEDGSRVGTVYFLMDEANVVKATALPWMSFGSDGSSQAPEGVFLQSSTHPRTYGNFARLLGKYVRDEKRLDLAEAVRRLTSLPAANLKIADRGMLKAGNFADVVIFDPATIADKASFAKPQVYATGMRDVFVNGVQVLKDGEHTGAMPGRFVRGPGFGRCPG